MIRNSLLLLSCAVVALTKATPRQAAPSAGPPQTISGMELVVVRSRRAKYGNFTEVAVAEPTDRKCAAMCDAMPTCLAMQMVPVANLKFPTGCALYTSLADFAADGTMNDGPGTNVYLHKQHGVASCKANEYFGFYADREENFLSYAGCYPLKKNFDTCVVLAEYPDIDWTNDNAGCVVGTVCLKVSQGGDGRCQAKLAGDFKRVVRGDSVTGGNFTTAVSNATSTSTNTTAAINGTAAVNGTNTTTWNDATCSSACNATSTCLGFTVVSNTTTDATDCRLYTSLSNVTVTGNGSAVSFFASKSRANQTCTAGQIFIVGFGGTRYAQAKIETEVPEVPQVVFVGCVNMAKEGEKCPVALYKGGREWVESDGAERTDDGCEKGLYCNTELELDVDGAQRCMKKK